MSVPDRAGCEATSSTAEITDVTKGVLSDNEGQHQDANVEFTLVCRYAQQVTRIDFSNAFKTFEELQFIEFKGIFSDKAVSAKIGRLKPSIDL